MTMAGILGVMVVVWLSGMVCQILRIFGHFEFDRIEIVDVTSFPETSHFALQ